MLEIEETRPWKLLKRKTDQSLKELELKMLKQLNQVHLRDTSDTEQLNTKSK